MDFDKQGQLLDVKIRGLQNIAPFDHYTVDGIVNLDKWRKQQIRPLFLGKEAHGNGNGLPTWSMKDWLNDDPEDICQLRPHSWQKTAYVSYALQHNLMSYAAIPYIRDEPAVAQALRNIAFVNVGKHCAEKTTLWSRLTALYEQNRMALHEQIGLYQPNIIIGWGTLWLLENDSHFMSEFAANKTDTSSYDSVDCWSANGRLYISAYHPSYFKINPTRYVNSITDAVKAHINDIDMSLPKL